MTLVWWFVVLSTAVVVVELLAMRASGGWRARRAREDARELTRLTAEYAPPRQELTCVVGAHRCEAHAVDTGHIARHHVLDRWTLRRVLHEPTAAYAMVGGTVYGSGEWEILTGHIGRELVAA